MADENLPEVIRAELGKISDQVKSHAEKAEKEIKAHAKLSEETKASVDKLLTEQGELRARLQQAEQLVAKMEQGGSGRVDHPKSMGEQLSEAEGFDAWRENVRGSFRTPVKAAITSDLASAGEIIVPDRQPGIVTPPNQQLRIRNLLSWGRTTSNSVEFVRETGFTNNAGPVGENPSGGKPQSNLVFEEDAAKVVTIAHFIRATKQVLADVPMLQSYVNTRLTYGLKLVEDRQLLKGSGVGINLNGIYTQATAYANPGITVQNETAIDRLRLALLQAELAEYDADGIVLNPIEWAAIELQKTTTNEYLFSNPRFVTQAGLWGRPVVTTKALDATEFLVGSFQQGAQGWDREDVNLVIALQDADNVTKNMVTLLVEERLALTVYRPEAFVKGTFAAPVSV